jgi:hypothetical protein
MAESHYAGMLANDEWERQEGTGSEPVFQSVAKQLSAAGIDYRTPFTVGELPEAGLSDREIYKRKDTLEYELAVVPPALARGDITVIKEELDELLYAFQLNVDRKSPSYRKLGMAVLTAHVRALRDIEPPPIQWTPVVGSRSQEVFDGKTSATSVHGRIQAAGG